MIWRRETNKKCEKQKQKNLIKKNAKKKKWNMIIKVNKSKLKHRHTKI